MADGIGASPFSDDQGCHGGSHAGEFGLSGRLQAHERMGVQDRFGHGVTQDRGRTLLSVGGRQEFREPLGNGLGGDPTGDVSAGVPTHPVGNDGNAVLVEEDQMVLVAGADPADVGEAGEGEGRGHRGREVGGGGSGDTEGTP